MCDPHVNTIRPSVLNDVSGPDSLIRAHELFFMVSLCKGILSTRQHKHLEKGHASDVQTLLGGV